MAAPQPRDEQFDSQPGSESPLPYEPLEAANDNQRIRNVKIKHKKNTAGTALKTGGRSAQATGASMQATGTAMQATGVTMRAGGKAGEVVGGAVMKAGTGLSSTGIGAIVGVPLVVVGGTTKVAGKATNAAGKGVQKSGKQMRRTGKRVQRVGRRARKAGKQVEGRDRRATKTTLVRKIAKKGPKKIKLKKDKVTGIVRVMRSVLLWLWLAFQLPFATLNLVTFGIAGATDGLLGDLLNFFNESLDPEGWFQLTNTIMLAYGLVLILVISLVFIMASIPPIGGRGGVQKKSAFIMVLIGFSTPFLNFLPWHLLWIYVIKRYPN